MDSTDRQFLTDIQNMISFPESDGELKIGDESDSGTMFQGSGHQTMEGNARPWRDELADAINLRQTGAGVSINNTEGVVEFTTGALYTNDYMFCNPQLNHDKDLESAIYPHLHWFQDRNAVPNFILLYRWQKNGLAKVTSWTPIKCNNIAVPYTTGTILQIAYSDPIPVPTGTGLSDIVQFRIARDNANNSGIFDGLDTFNATVGILAFDLHFMINSLGSNEEFIK
jgi:hypothetical protein